MRVADRAGQNRLLSSCKALVVSVRSWLPLADAASGWIHRLWILVTTPFFASVLLAIWFSLTGAMVSQADQPSGWQVVGQIGGPTQAVAVQGRYAYVGVGLRLVVLDVTNPVTPTEVGATTPFPYFVEDVAVSGERVYVAAGGAGLRVVDIP